MRRSRGCPALALPFSLLLLLAVFFPACGGGGGGGGGSAAEEIYLGTVAYASPTRVEVAFRNPLGTSATVSLAGYDGPFTADPADLPAACGPGQEVTIGVICDADVMEDVEGTLTLRFDTGAESREKRWLLTAWAEPPAWEPAYSVYDFGWVFVGGSLERQIAFHNDSLVSPVVIESLGMPGAEFQVVGGGLPFSIPPGSTSGPILRFTPAGEGVVAGDLVVGSNVSEGLRRVPMRGEGRIRGEEIVTDYGTPQLDAAGRTPILTVSVPADAVSLSLEGHGAAGDAIGLDTLTGPDGTVYENTASTGPYQWFHKYRPTLPIYPEAFLTTLPNSDRTNVQLVAGGGDYTFSLKSNGSSLQVRAIVERRAPELAHRGVLDLNVFLSTKIDPTAAGAEDDEVLQSVIARADSILQSAGIRLGDIDYYDLSEAISSGMSPDSLPQLFRESSQATKVRLNVFLYQNISFSLRGMAGAVGGPKLNGTAQSGVYVYYNVTEKIPLEGLPYLDAAAVLAHEIAHYLGLHHVVDSDGTPDIIDDSANSPPNLMYYSPNGTYLSAGQGRVMRGHPHVQTDMEYATEWDGKTTLRLSLDSWTRDPGLSPGWCGSCGR